MKKNKLYYFTLGVILTFPFIFFTCSNEKGPAPANCDSNPVTVQSVNTTQASCGKTDGSLEIIADGGSGIYSFSIDGVNFQTSNSFKNLSAGNYSITIKDNNKCEVTGMAAVISASGLSLTVQTLNAGCGSSNGSVTITGTGGAEPYQYGIAGGSPQSNNNFSGLSVGQYSVFVKDAEGCKVTESVKILSGTSYKNDIVPILTTNCILSGCHDGKSGVPNWGVKANVISNASMIKQLTQSKVMPKTGSLTDAEIQTIACWVDDGAKDN